MFWISPELYRYSLHKCRETILCLKRQFTIHVSPVSHVLGFTEARKTCHRVVGTSMWSIPYSAEFCNKNCRHDFRDVDRVKCVLLHYCTTGSDKSDARERVPDWLLKECQWCLGYTVDMLNCCWPTDVHSWLWLSILRELWAIIECHT